MRISLMALALGILLPTAWAAAAEISRTTFVDPITGTRTTEIIRTSDWDTYYSAPLRVHRVHGYRVMPTRIVTEATLDARGFPLNPRDGQEVWVDGLKWEWDADDGRWERD